MSVPSMPAPAQSQNKLVLAITPARTSHPTACPSWCKDRRHVEGHHYGPTATWHWGQQYQLANPNPLPDTTPVIMRAELFRNDELSVLGEVSMYLSGETDIEMGAGEVDAFIVQAQAFVDTLRAMRAQMG